MIPAHRILPGVVAEIIRKAPLCPEKVAFAWRTAVGPALARVTSAELRDHALVVTAASPHWAHEVGRATGLILARLEILLGPGVVKRIEARATSDGRDFSTRP
ncbi:MAG: DUF721 domain-containing protein [Acidobacteria bacterium]|nr:DUF721 domain-containing protein [Acidobacteriota bacterium]